MTGKQHLAAAERFGELSRSLACNKWLGEPFDAETTENAILAGHHANAAMKCWYCLGDGQYFHDHREDKPCHGCYGRGWLNADEAARLSAVVTKRRAKAHAGRMEAQDEHHDQTTNPGEVPCPRCGEYRRGAHTCAPRKG